MIMFIYGPDTYRSRQKLKEFKNAFISKYDPIGSSLTVLDGESLTFHKFNDAVGSSSLFAQKRMVVIENIFSAKNKELAAQLENYLKGKQEGDGSVIVFWQDTSGMNIEKNKFFQFLSGQKQVYSFPALSNTDAAEWVKKECLRRGAKIKPAAAAHLTAMFVNDLWQISNEIDKLISYRLGSVGDNTEATIDLPDVMAMCRGISDENIFALTDAISNNQKATVAELFEKEIDAGMNEIYLLSMIQRQFRILLQVRQALDLGYSPRKIMSELKLHPFVAQKAINQVRNFSLPVLKRIFQALVNIDRQVKTGRLECKAALNILLAKI